MFDWTHLQTFLAVAEHGSLSGAARATGGSQPTMGRHIRCLEAALSQPLFTRTQGGLALTPLGIELSEHARNMGDIAGQIALTAAGQGAAIAGTIRLTASDIVAAHILPDMLVALRSVEPEIQVEVVASDRTENLLRRGSGHRHSHVPPGTAGHLHTPRGHVRHRPVRGAAYLDGTAFPDPSMTCNITTSSVMTAAT